MIEAPTELRARNQWVVWRYEQRPDDPKPTKVPYNAQSGRRASSTDPSTWSSYMVANAYLDSGHADGIGYVLSADDPYAGVDLDHCRDPATGTIEQWAKVVVFRLGSYTEISPSGTGLRIFVIGELPPHGRHKGNIEVYCQARFLTITGDRYGAAPGVINDRHAELLAWHHEVFGERVAASARANGHAAGTPSDLDDTELLERARRADNGDRFWELWNGDWSAAYASHSEADLALANYLAFYCGPDPGRIERLFELSGLMREKWAARADYRAWTIDKALNGRTDYYDPRYRSNGRSDDFGVGAGVGQTDQQPGENQSLTRTFAELIAGVANMTDTELVEHFLWSGCNHWLYSGPGLGKTLLSFALALHVAAGRAFHGLKVTQGGVLIIEEDSSDLIVRKYMEDLSEIYELQIDALPLRFHNVPGLRIVDQTGLETVRRMITEMPFKPSIVLYDACERLVPSEKFNSKELDALGRLFKLNTRDGIANVMIDHTRKSPPKGGEKVDPVDLLYGGRSKSALADVMMHLSGSIRSRGMLNFQKFRGAYPTPVQISFDGAAGFSIRAQKVELTESERQVMKIINNAMGRLLTREEIEQHVRLSKPSLLRVLGRLIELGWVERSGDSHATVYGVGGAAGGLFD